MPRSPLDAVLCHVRRLATKGAPGIRPINPCFDASPTPEMRQHSPSLCSDTGPWYWEFVNAGCTIRTRPMTSFRLPSWRWPAVRSRSVTRRRWAAGCTRSPTAWQSRTRFATAKSPSPRTQVGGPRCARPSGRDELCEMCAVLDAELQALPDRFRAPLVLCYLEGLTRDEAAGNSPTTNSGDSHQPNTRRIGRMPGRPAAGSAGRPRAGSRRPRPPSSTACRPDAAAVGGGSAQPASPAEPRYSGASRVGAAGYRRELRRHNGTGWARHA